MIFTDLPQRYLPARPLGAAVKAFHRRTGAWTQKVREMGAMVGAVTMDIPTEVGGVMAAEAAESAPSSDGGYLKPVLIGTATGVLIWISARFLDGMFPRKSSALGGRCGR